MRDIVKRTRLAEEELHQKAIVPMIEISELLDELAIKYRIDRVDLFAYTEVMLEEFIINRRK